MELTIGSVSLSPSFNETSACRWSAETTTAQNSRASSVSHVSVSGSRPLSSRQHISLVHGGNTGLTSRQRKSCFDVTGLGCKLFIQKKKCRPRSQDSRWQASAVAESSSTGAEDIDVSVHDAPSISETTVHVVQEGDTLTAIAKQYNTTVDRIARDNGIDDINLLQTGEKLVVPVWLAGVPKASSARIRSEARNNPYEVHQRASASGGQEVPSVTLRSGINAASTIPSADPMHRSFPAGNLVRVTIPLLLIAPIIGFCIRCVTDYIHERINKEVALRHAELETYHARHRPRVKRWQGILDYDREEVPDLVEAAVTSDRLDASRFKNEQQIPTGYASIRAMNEESIANESDEERSSRQTQDYEDVRKSYAALESKYMKFLSDSRLSTAGYWRGSVPQLQEDV